MRGAHAEGKKKKQETTNFFELLEWGQSVQRSLTSILHVQVELTVQEFDHEVSGKCPPYCIAANRGKIRRSKDDLRISWMVGKKSRPVLVRSIPLCTVGTTISHRGKIEFNSVTIEVAWLCCLVSRLSQIQMITLRGTVRHAMMLSPCSLGSLSLVQSSIYFTL